MLNEECVFGSKYCQARKLRHVYSDSAFADSEQVVLLGIDKDTWLKSTVPVLCQMGLKRDYLYIQKSIQRSILSKKLMIPSNKNA